jgi:hypothetical protein
MDAKPVVWITNVAGHDHEKAKEFGLLKHVTRGFVNLENLDRVKFLIAAELAVSKPNDYILLTGANIVACICVLVFFYLHGHVNIITFAKKEEKYRTLRFDKDSMATLYNMLQSDEDRNAANQETITVE